MCGITGYIERNNRIDSTDIIDKMVSMIYHRGPNDHGTELLNVFCDAPTMAMGFTRLSILDTSPNGHQPMYDAEHTVCISFNGEIYNAFDYTEELKSKGYVFKSNSDTEVILYLYKEYGIEGMLQRINGMFAIALADLKRHKVYLVRDRVGVKPLYYYQNDNVVLYSSEYKTFYAHPEFRYSLNADALSEQFMFRYIAGRETLINGVYNVLPGEYLEITENQRINIHRYWDAIGDNVYRKMDMDAFEGLVRKSVEKRLLSDVPLGVQLSGGGWIVHLYSDMLMNIVTSL